MPRGGSSHDRRRQRRAAGRDGATGLKEAPRSASSAELGAEQLLAAASGSTSLPLSDRDTAWDAAAARRSLSPGQFGSAHFWRDSSKPADQITSYKLGFAVNNGGLTAIWRGVTACAAVMQGSRGGVQIPDSDRAGVKSRIASYYSKAAKKYNDPSIKVPWESAAEDAVEILKARGLDTTRDLLEHEIAAVALANAANSPGSEEFGSMLEHWTAYLAPSPEQAALALVQAFADGEVTPSMPCDNCDHTAMQHEGDDNMGACTIDGCDCDGFQPEAEAGDGEASVTSGGVISTTTPVFENNGFVLNHEQVQKLTLLLDHMRLEAAAGEAVLPDAPAATGGLRWIADAVFEGVLTDDGRCFAPGALSWRELPLTLGAMLDTPHADVVTESRAAGAITSIERQGNTLVARGEFDAGEFGQEVARMVSDGTLRGISVDVAVQSSEVAPKLDFFDENGNWREVRIETSAPETDLLDVLFGDPQDMIYVIDQGTIGAITVCPFPAFADARIEIAKSLAAGGSPAVVSFQMQSGMRVFGKPVEVVEVVRDVWMEKALQEEFAKPVVMTASAEGLAPLKPSASWFKNPRFKQLTALTVSDEGRVSGHAAPWGTCHIAIPDVCTEAPHTETDYDYFHLKEVVTEEGERIACGTITMGTGHAGRGLDLRDTTAHYDNTGMAVADVVVGEDEYGIWVAGALRPDISAADARKLQGAVLSGDWRYVEFSDGTGNLELVGLLAVNVPGFPIPRTRALVAAGEDGLQVVALVAAGVHIGSREDEQLEKIRMLADLAKYKALVERAQA